MSSEKRTAHFALRHLNPFGPFKDVFTLKDVRTLLVMGAFFAVGLGIYQFNFSIFVKDVFAWGPAFICHNHAAIYAIAALLAVWALVMYARTATPQPNG